MPDEKKGQELVSLLEDEAFCIVSQMGCDDAIDYTVVTDIPTLTPPA